MKKIFVICLFLGLFLNSAAFLTYNDFDIKVIVKGSKNKEGNLRVREEKGILYCSAMEFAELLEVNTNKVEDLKKLVIYLDGKQIKLTAHNPYMMIDKQIFQMITETKVIEDKIYVPLAFFTDILNRFLPSEYLLDERKNVLEINTLGSINLFGLTIEEKTNGTLIRLSSSRDFTNKIVHWVDEETNILYVTIHEGILDTVSIAKTQVGGVVRRVIPTQLPENAQIAFSLRRKLESRDVFCEKSTNDIVLTLQPLGARNRGVQRSTEDILNKDKEGWIIDTIVLDPGHGGRDPGTTGRSGVHEKDIVLDIAKRLGSLIENKLKIKVVYTRKRDRYVTLKRRAEIANSSGGKLFISIHVNWNKNRNARGFDTYFLRPGMNKAALNTLEIEAKENDVVNMYESGDEFEEFNEEDLVLLSMTQSAFVKESEQLAFHVSQELDRQLALRNRGVKQAGFLVLWAAAMPHVFIETGFISNRSDENNLRTKAVKQKIAQGIFNGVDKFIKNLRK